MSATLIMMRISRIFHKNIGYIGVKYSVGKIVEMLLKTPNIDINVQRMVYLIGTIEFQFKESNEIAYLC